MLDETIKTALEQNSGTIIGWLGVGAAALWGLVKVLPVVNGTLDTAAKSTTMQSGMLTTVREDLDKANTLIRELLKEREGMVRDLAQAQAQITVLTERCSTMQALVDRLEAFVGPMQTHVKRATRLIESSTPAPLEGERHG